MVRSGCARGECTMCACAISTCVACKPAAAAAGLHANTHRCPHTHPPRPVYADTGAAAGSVQPEPPVDSMFDVMNADQLIQAVRRRPAVWDPRHIGHNNRLLINKLWQEVADELAIDKNMAKSKWRGLRDYYRQEMKKQTNYPSSDHGTAEYRSSWALFDQMSFVRNTILPRRQREGIATMISATEMDTLDTAAGAEYYEDDPITICIPKLEPQLDLPEFLPPQQQSPTMAEYGEAQANKLPQKHHNDNDDDDGGMEWKRRKLALLERRTSEENANDDLQFFKSLLPDMANLPRAKKSYIRLKIQEIIHREVHGNAGIVVVKDECC